MLLETNRHVLLRQMNADDAPVIWEYSLDPQIRESDNRLPDSYEAFADTIHTMITPHEDPQHPRSHYTFCIVLPDNQEHPLGIVYLSIHSHISRQASLGFMLGVDYWKVGYATDALLRILKFGFEELKLHRIFATVLANNHHACHLMQKLEFTQEAHLHETDFFNDQWHDTYIYARLASTWRG